MIGPLAVVEVVPRLDPLRVSFAVNLLAALLLQKCRYAVTNEVAHIRITHWMGIPSRGPLY